MNERDESTRGGIASANIRYVRESGDPDISVVVPTLPRNDCTTIIQALQQQSFNREYEILLVIDAELTLAEARNAGIQASEANIVALADDDTLPPIDWLRNIWVEFEKNPDLVLLEGAVYGGINYRGTSEYVGCNLAMDREAALQIGGFDEEYSGWREDTEFGWRMEEASLGRCTFSPIVQMYHPGFPRSDPIWEHEHRLREKYPDRYDRILNATPSQRLYRWAQHLGVAEYLHRIRYWKW